MQEQVVVVLVQLEQMLVLELLVLEEQEQLLQ